MKNIIFTTITILIIVGGLIWLSASSKQNDNSNRSSGGNLSLQENFYDFGSISMAAGKVSRSFKIKNDTSESAIIEKMYTSCMCTFVSLLQNGKETGPFGMAGHGFIPKIDKIISSGEEVEAKVVFDPAAHGPAGVGLIERVVYIEQLGKSPIQIEIKATVTP